MAGAGTAQWSDGRIDKQMSAIQVPCLILFGEYDRVVPTGNAQLMAAKIPQAQIKTLPNVGHIFPIEDPQATTNTLIQFIQD